MKKTQETKWNRVDRTKGKYRPLGRLVVDFGGWECPDAVKGGITAATKCAAMGFPWVKKHPQSELLEFLVLETEFEEDFSKSWSHFVEEFAGEAENVKGVRAAAPVVTKKETPEKQTQKEVVDNKQKKDNKAAADSKKHMATLFKDSTKLRLGFQACSTQYLDIISKVEGETPNWVWAKNSEVMVKLKNAWHSLSAGITPLHTEFTMCDDLTALKKKYTDDRLSTELATFLTYKEQIANVTSVASSMRIIAEEMQK
jgi:hypothetical protein